MLGNKRREEPSNAADFAVRDVVAAYDRAAEDLVSQYERLAFEQVHASVLDLVPKSDICVLDVGAGSGRDAAWFASKSNNTVIVVEPSNLLMQAGQKLHSSPKITWIDDSLPELEKVMRLKLTFDLIWLSGIWTHIPPSSRKRAFRKLVSVMRPGGSLMMSIRRGPPPPDRPHAPTTAAAVEQMAHHYGLRKVRTTTLRDTAGRIDVSWEVLWLQLPDDGTGALPLIRHVVFRDQKSATYKLALLRALIRIADSACGYARHDRETGFVELPIGLVSLFWVRSFWALIERNLPQHPRGNAKLSFVKDGFCRLLSRSPYDLRVGQHFVGEDAVNLIRALRNAAKCIRNNPATHITYPGSLKRVFPYTRGRPVYDKTSIRIDEPFLWSFGSFFVPVHVWQAMCNHAPWIEPAILSEWVHLMRSYSVEPASWEEHYQALNWLDPDYDTGIVRKRAFSLRATGISLFCVWTGRKLRRKFDIDHCFPFAAWPCNDLWNLLPSHPTINRQKGDRLPKPQALENARSCIQDWWEIAYRGTSPLRRRFNDECRSALPLTDSNPAEIPIDSLFEGLMIQQLVLKRDQQLAEWAPL